MQGTFLRKYGVETTVDFTLFETDGVDFKVDAVHASGDTKVMKDEGAEANTSNGFVDRGQGYSITLTATEMQAARAVVYIVDQATKAWLDTSIVIETYGNASAMHAFDLDTPLASQTVGTCTTNTDMRGTDSALLASSAPTNFGDLAITVTTGKVTVGTNDDKTGYSISGTKTTLDALNDVSTSQVNAEVLDVLTVDTFAEPAQATPSNTPTIADMCNQLFRKIVKDKVTATATSEKVFMNDGSTVRYQRAISDDSTTTTKGAAA